MTVHVFPSGRKVADVRPMELHVTQARASRTELWLVAGLVAATAAQAGLCVWFWLG